MSREREQRHQETPEQLEWLRARLAKSINGGVSQTYPDDLLSLFKDRLKQKLYTNTGCRR